MEREYVTKGKEERIRKGLNKQINFYEREEKINSCGKRGEEVRKKREGGRNNKRKDKRMRDQN